MYTKIVNTCLRITIEHFLLENLSDFNNGRSCCYNTFCMNQTITERRQYNWETRIAFVVLEKALDTVNRTVGNIGFEGIY